jgi:2-polyprenyl-6-methoxyphenol hydroxylase-like FAD-dependent oxidoreductase
MRGDLANVLYEATRHHTTYIFNDSIASLVQTSGRVRVTFKHHEPREYDLVFGADGLHSKVRSMAFGEEASFIRRLGVYIAIFTTPNFMNQGMDALFYSVPGKRVGIFGASKGREARASFYFAADKLHYNYRDVEQQKQIIRNKFTGEAWQVPQLLEMMERTPDFYFDSISQIRMDRWSNGRVALLGDAAHCASPMSGMGTSMAIIGAYILAGELKQANGDYQRAFASYEAQMRAFVQRCQAMANGIDWFVPKTKFKRWISLQMWKLLPYTPWKNMMIEMPTKVANSITLKTYC